MAQAAVFAGLGSETLFSNDFVDRILADASTPLGESLLHSCYEVFQHEILQPSEGSQQPPLNLGVSDFDNPIHLIKPLVKYRKNPIVQHSTICLAHLLRYLHLNYVNTTEPPICSYTTGLCVGLLPAVAASSSSNPWEYLKRAQEVYRLAVIIGRVSYLHSIDSGVNASAIVSDGISHENISSLVEEYNHEKGASVYVSAYISSKNVTISGPSADVAQFRDMYLHSNVTRSTNISCFYHNEELLRPRFEEILDFCGTKDLPFASCSDITSPIVLPSNGALIDCDTTETLLGMILSEILLLPVNWEAVESALEKLCRTGNSNQIPIVVMNYGPGQTALKRYRQPNSDIHVQSVTFLDSLGNEAGEDLEGREKDVAIVGMAAQVADADDYDEFWTNLESGKNSCKEIPQSRFDYRDIRSSSGEKSGRSLNTKWGNFIRNPFAFDNNFFSISPREALSMDPQQRMMLKTTHRALEDAGYVPDSTRAFARESFGCYIGNATLDYVDNLREEIDVYYSPGTLRAFISGRISYFYGWSGPSMTIDTVCSSSMTSINQAVRAIQTGDCRAAVAGGVNVISSPDMYIGLDRAHFLSPSGQCKAFDASADGYTRAEGCGAVVLKSLEDALAENDHILGVIRGAELNQSGNATSITHPHPPTQEILLNQLLQKSNTDPNDVSVVEAHGTGTQAGDPNELASICNSLCSKRKSGNPLHITSLKANVGHCEAASGVIAMIKMCLMLKYSRIPPQVSLRTLNPKIRGLEERHVTIPTTSKSWDSGNSRKRLGLVNNFGAAGSNGAVLIEEPPSHAINSVETLTDEYTFTLALSAKTEESLRTLRDQTIEHLSSVKDKTALMNVCYTSTARRQIYDHRLIAKGRDQTELVENLEKAPIKKASSESNNAVFLFSGQGSQYFGMGATLIRLFSSFKKHVMHCHELLVQWDKPSCLDIFNAPSESTFDKTNAGQIEAFQSAMFVLEVGLAQLVMSWGIKPTALVGHSLGEYAAFVVAGMLSLEDGLRMVCHRASLLTRNCSPGSHGMLAVNNSEAKTLEFIENEPSFNDLSISCDNTSTSCVVGGLMEEISALKEKLNADGTKCKILETPFAYHTAQVSEIESELTSLARSVTLHPPKYPVVSNVSGGIFAPEQPPPSPEYFAQHCHSKVRFTEGLSALLDESSRNINCSNWLELGPHPSILPMIQSQVKHLGFEAVPSLNATTEPSRSMADILIHFGFSRNVPNWRAYFEGMLFKPQITKVPGMPFQETDYLVPYKEKKTESSSAESQQNESFVPYALLSRCIEDSGEKGEGVAVYETDWAIIEPFVSGHTVCGVPLCPASVFHELGLSAARHAFGEQNNDGILTLKNITFKEPLVGMPGSSKVVRTRLTQQDSSGRQIAMEISSLESATSEKSTTHCVGTIKARDTADMQFRSAQLLSESNKVKGRVEDNAEQILATKTIYDQVFNRVVTYSDLFQSIRSLKITGSGDEAVARCELPSMEKLVELSGEFVAEPVLMDTLLHACGFLCNAEADEGDVFICHSVKSAATMRHEDSLDVSTFEVRCTNVSIEKESAVIGEAMAIDAHGTLAVVKGMHFQRVKLARMQKALSRALEPANRPEEMNKTKQSPPKSNTKPETKPEPAIVERSQHDKVVEILASACGTQESKINMDMSLEALGIDSLMMLELEASLQQVATNEFSAADLEQCLTVNDMLELVGPAKNHTTEKRPQSTTPPAQESPRSDQGNDEGLHAVIQAIAEVCQTDASQVTLDTDLEALGVDSLMMLELEAKLHEISDKDFHAAQMEECRQVRDIANLIDESSSSSHSSYDTDTDSKTPRTSVSGTPATQTPPELASPSEGVEDEKELQGRPRIDFDAETEKMLIERLRLSEQPELLQSAPPGGEHKPDLFLLHPGAGFSRPYYRLSSLLQRNVWAIHDEKLLKQHERWESVAEVANTYAKFIREAAKGKPVIISGWSFGGIVAYEIAKQLQQDGSLPVVGLLLVDPPPPMGYRSPRVSEILNALFGKIFGVETAKKSVLGDALHKLAASNAIRCADLLRDYMPTKDGPTPLTAFLYAIDPVSTDFMADTEDVDPPVDAWLSNRDNRDLALGGWYELLGDNMKVIDLPGNHFDILERDKIQSTTKRYVEACAWLEKNSKANLKGGMR